MKFIVKCLTLRREWSSSATRPPRRHTKAGQACPFFQTTCSHKVSWLYGVVESCDEERRSRAPSRACAGDGRTSLWVFGGQGADTWSVESSRMHQGVKIRSLAKRTCFNDFFEFDTRKL